MVNYTNMVIIVSSTRLKRLRASQTFSIVHPWSLGCAFVPLQESLNYFSYEIPEKRAKCNNNFPLKSLKSSNSFHRHDTNFDQGKLFPEKPLN